MTTENLETHYVLVRQERKVALHKRICPVDLLENVIEARKKHRKKWELSSVKRFNYQSKSNSCLGGILRFKWIFPESKQFGIWYEIEDQWLYRH